MSDLENVHQSHRHLSTPVAFTSVERACMLSLCIYDIKHFHICWACGKILILFAWSFSPPWDWWWEVNVQLVDDVLVHVEVVVLLVDKIEVVVILVVVVVVQIVGNVGNSAVKEKNNPADKLIRSLGGLSPLQSFDGWPKNGDSHGEESHLREGDRAWICCGGTLLPSWKKRFK